MSSKQKQCNLALFGLGRAGTIHFHNIIANYRVKLMYLVEIPKLHQKVQDLIDTYNASYVKILSPDKANQIYDDPDVDGVIVCTPTFTHEEIIKTALKHGKAVFCEKPISASLEGTNQCYKAAEEAGKPLLCSYNRRFDPSLINLQQKVRAGDIGKVYTIKSSARDHPIPPIAFLKHSGGLYHDTGSHDIDLLCWVLDEYPDTVYSMGHCHNEEIKSIGDLDTVAIIMKFPSGALATIDYSRNSSYGYDQRCEVFGSKGMLISENQRPTELTAYNKEGTSMLPMKYSFPQRYSDSYIGAINHFVDVIRGNAKLEVTKEQTMRVSQIAEACEHSYKTGQPVDMKYEQM